MIIINYHKHQKWLSDNQKNKINIFQILTQNKIFVIILLIHPIFILLKTIIAINYYSKLTGK
jgi:hypothetical protein